jgi:hypothetical protein
MPVACAQCGSESTLGEVYAVETSALGRKRHYCPRCWREMHVRRAREALVVPILLAGGAFVLLALGRSVVGTGVAWFFLNLCLVAFFLELATLPHELGHALTAHVLGFRGFSITTGVGPPLATEPILGRSAASRSSCASAQAGALWMVGSVRRCSPVPTPRSPIAGERRGHIRVSASKTRRDRVDSQAR